MSTDRFTRTARTASVLSALLIALSIVACVVLASSDDPSEGIFIALLVGAAVLVLAGELGVS